MIKQISLLITMLVSSVSYANKVTVLCNGCSIPLYVETAKSAAYDLPNKAGNVFVFDLDNHVLKKYAVGPISIDEEGLGGSLNGALNTYGSGVWAIPVIPTVEEAQIFTDFDEVHNYLKYTHIITNWPGSAYNIIGNNNAAIDLANDLRESDPVLFNGLAVLQTTMNFVEAGWLTNFEYEVVVFFEDGTRVTMVLKQLVLQALSATYFDSDHNPIPLTSNDLDGLTIVFEDPYNRWSFLDRIEFHLGVPVSFGEDPFPPSTGLSCHMDCIDSNGLLNTSTEMPPMPSGTVCTMICRKAP